MSQQKLSRKRVYEFYYARETIHFSAENISSRIIKRAENESGHQRKLGSGRIAKVMTKKAVENLKRMFDHKDAISQRLVNSIALESTFAEPCKPRPKSVQERK